MGFAKLETQMKLENSNSSSSSSGVVSLYVGDLSPDVTEQDLVSKFSLTVPVLSVHLCRNSITGKSMCYAYINFDSTITASNAMACLNHTELKGRAMRIMWCQKDIAYRRLSGMGNLFVKNLDSSISSICLERMFSRYGNILSCKVVVENGVSKGFGFVQFETEQSAVAARCSLNGTMVDGKKLFVAKFISKNERAAMSGNQEFTNVYVGNLMENATEDDLHKVFSQYGKISSAVVMRDGMGRSRGFGFVDFCYPGNAKKAVESLNGKHLLTRFGSKALFVGKAVRKAERLEMLKQKQEAKVIAKFNLYVKNLSDSVDDTRLCEIFGRYGKIISAKVMHHENGRSKGFGFVGYANLEESKQAKSKLNGSLVDGKPLVVRVAERKEDRFKRMQQFFQGKPRPYMQAPPVPPPAQPVPPQVQLVRPSMPSSYGYCQPVHIGASYYYMGTPLPPNMVGHQNITPYFQVPAGQAHPKEKRSVSVVYKHPFYPFAKSGAKQKLVFNGEGNKNIDAAAICSKETTCAEEINQEASSVILAAVQPSPDKKAGQIGVACT